MHRLGVSLAFLIAALFTFLPTAATAEPVDENDLPLFEDRPEPLVPANPRSEADEDRVRASALYAHGRVLFQRREFPAALRRYQRAWRNDPTAVRVLDDIVALARGLNRPAEQLRYETIMAEADPKDPLQLRRIAVGLIRQEEHARALRMFEKSLELQNNPTVGGDVAIIRLEMGRLYFLNEQYDKSAEAFAFVRKALAEPEEHKLTENIQKTLVGEAHRTFALMGEAFLQAGRADEAEEAFNEAHKAKADEALLAFNLARVQDKRGDVNAALMHLDKYFKAKSSGAGSEPYQLLAELLAKKPDEDKQAARRELRRWLEELHTHDADNIELAYYLSNLYLENNELDAAAKLYETLVAANPRLDGYQGLINVYRKKSDHVKLLDVLGSAVLKTGTLDVLGEPVEAVAKDAELLTKLLESAGKIVDANPDDLGEGVALAAALMASKAEKYDEADKFFELALKAPEPGPQRVLLTWGLELFMAEVFERSARVFQRAFDEKAVEDNNAQVHFYLSGALEMAGKSEEALAEAKRAIAADPNSPRMQARLPWILYHAKRYDDAEKGYLALMKELDPQYDSEETRQVMRDARFVLSNICIQLNRMSESEEWLEQVLDEFPEDIGAMNDLGYLWADQGKRLHRSLDMVRKAVDAEQDNYAYRDSLGWALFRLGRFDEAVKELEQAATGDDPDGVVLDHLGDAYLSVDQRDKAVETWKRAVEAFKKQDDPKALQKTEAKIKMHSAG